MALDRETVTDAMDIAGVGLAAAGVGGGLWDLLGWWALCVAAVVVLAGSATINARGQTRRNRRAERRTTRASALDRRGV